MIEIKITKKTPLEALASLTAFATHCMECKEVMDAANLLLEQERRNEQKKAGDAAAVVANTEKVQSGHPHNSVEKSADVQEKAKYESKSEPATSQAPTLEEVRKKVVDAAHEYGQKAVREILKDFNVPGITELAENDRIAFMAKLDKLGEKNA